jgi:DNA polymerase
MDDKHTQAVDEAIEMTRVALAQKLELGDDLLAVDAKYLEGLKMVQKTKTYKNLDDFEADINTCTKCPLHKGRTKFVFGDGNPKADVMFVGEGPGRDEDLQGKPFVGRAGKLLDKILAAINFSREDVYIANMVKCRPPGNRDPEPEEMDACRSYLMKQIEMIDPAIICCLGRVSGQALLDSKLPLGKLRGGFHDFDGRKVILTYHPAALLRFPKYKRDTWEDVQKLRAEYDRMKAAGEL